MLWTAHALTTGPQPLARAAVAVLVAGGLGLVVGGLGTVRRSWAAGHGQPTAPAADAVAG